METETKKYGFGHLLLGFVAVVIVVIFFAYDSKSTQENDTNTISSVAEEIESVDTQEVIAEEESELIYEVLEQSVYAPNGEKFLVLIPRDSAEE